MLVAGIAGPGLVRARRPRALPDAQVPVREPGDFLVLLVGRGGARLGVGAMGTVVALVFGDRRRSGCGSTRPPVDWPLLVVVAGAGPRADHRPRRAARRGLPPDAPGELVLPGRLRRRAVPGQRRRLPARGAAATPSRRSASSTRSPGGSRACGSRCPGRPVVHRRRRLAVDGRHRYRRAGRDDDRRRLVRDRGAGYTRGDRHLPSSERRARDLGLLDRTTGS